MRTKHHSITRWEPLTCLVIENKKYYSLLIYLTGTWFRVKRIPVNLIKAHCMLSDIFCISALPGVFRGALTQTSWSEDRGCCDFLGYINKID